MGSVDPAVTLRRDERGSVTAMELLSPIVQAAADRPPAEVAAAMPEWLLHQLREASAIPPASPDGAPRGFHAGSWAGPFDHAAWEQQGRQLWYEGVRRWHHYFHDGA